jgi:protein SCO1/2
MDVVMWGKEPIGGSFTLVDHNGQPRTHADFHGKILLVYFGFTVCADACPTDLQAMAGAIDKLGPMGEAVQPLFITVKLKSYVAIFHPRMIGLTGSRRQIADVRRAYKVYFARTTPGRPNRPEFQSLFPVLCCRHRWKICRFLRTRYAGGSHDGNSSGSTRC